MKKKKLQVFISSTFTDLIEERKAAVEAILSSGHIPAGMELFTAGDETQMEVIKRWIEESDIYLLLLGGRYGSIESSSGKSYTHLEYDYAIELEKSLFAVVISENSLEEKVKRNGTSSIEIENPKKLKEFRAEVITRLVKFYDDNKDIKISVHETMNEFARREELVGWIRSDNEIDTANLADELARLTKENFTLRSQIDRSLKHTQTFSGLSFNEFKKLLKRQTIDLNKITAVIVRDAIKEGKEYFDDDDYNLLHLVWGFEEEFWKGIIYGHVTEIKEEIGLLIKFNLLIYKSDTREYCFSGIGEEFNLRLQLEHPKNTTHNNTV